MNRRSFLSIFSLSAAGLYIPRSYFFLRGNPLAMTRVVAPFLRDKGYGQPDNLWMDWASWQKLVLEVTGEYVRCGDRISIEWPSMEWVPIGTLTQASLAAEYKELCHEPD